MEQSTIRSYLLFAMKQQEKEKEESHIEVKRSRLPKGGFGLFAKELIPQDSVICRYEGEVISLKNSFKYAKYPFFSMMFSP